jgi:hypothetical protein
MQPMRIRRLICLLSVIATFSFSLYAQKPLTLSLLEDSLSAIGRKIHVSGNDSARQTLNFKFRQTLRTAIALPGSFNYPFDSLKKLEKLTSPDNAFRLYNWNLPLTDGTNRYFCFIQFTAKNKKSGIDFIELSDRSDSIADPEHNTLGAGNWYGALYYRIIREKSQSGITYTLLGWEGLNATTMQKIIEIMTFDDLGTPHFGKKLFNKYKDGSNKRVIFSYSSMASMVVRYDGQFIPKGKKWNPSKRKFDENRSKAHLIVCDRLIQLEQKEGNSPMLVPAGDIYDGFLFENSQWNFIEGVDARNH